MSVVDPGATHRDLWSGRPAHETSTWLSGSKMLLEAEAGVSMAWIVVVMVGWVRVVVLLELSVPGPVNAGCNYAGKHFVRGQTRLPVGSGTLNAPTTGSS
ncbi:hypothetical protein N657DRAFT_278247 [Parathielavia appendiculata]|uniref:Uncharacterized protein n=1 Tax=Parathielavia appendiculata TaxID=2587402 RepID=A0AAN6U3H0_9PEZI|nr:hypothetical protein N657DRAFT_278247 [Parathielavia appendiculata]